MWNDFEKDKHILANQYSNIKYIEDSGMPIRQVKEGMLKIRKECGNTNETRGKIIKYLLSNLRLAIIPEDFFQDIVERSPRIIDFFIRTPQLDEHKKVIKDILDENADGQECLYYEGFQDFSHTSPYWQNIVTLGIPGLKKRAENKDGDFYKGVVLAYEGAQIYLKRLSREARKANTQRMNFVADALDSLVDNPPKNTYEGLYLIYLFFILQSEIECSYLRSFGSLDMLLYPLYKKDIESGTFTKEQIRILIKYFIQKLDSMKVWANQPFALCGTKGQDAVNELSYIFLEEFIKLKPVYTKVHIRYSKEIPQDFILKICESIRENGNSFVFINNKVASRALTLNGQDEKDTVDYGIIGCYEVYAQGTELPCSGNGNVNMAKAVEAVIFNGEDALSGKQAFSKKEEPKSYEEFLLQTKDYLDLFIKNTIKIINAYEEGYKNMQFAPFLSSTYDSCMEKGRDIYSGGAKYNSSSINMVGTASCADSLFAVKTLVYDEKKVTLKELREILKNDWEGYEDLRQYALSLAKYGNNIDAVDMIARDITDFCMNKINGQKNGHGGTYRGGTWSITNRLNHGKKTGATPDGRKAGEPLSKNVCAHTAQDKNGATAHILSALKLNYDLVPNGTVLDLALSHTAVKGQDGLFALKATLDTFMQNGGFAIQYNILNPQTLRDAQNDPEQYKTLQVRLCGWNVLFNSLTKLEQDEFILQSEVL